MTDDTHNSRSFRRMSMAAALAIALAVLLAYSNCTRNAFALDDWHAVVENPAIRGLNGDRVHRFFTDLNAFSILPANVDYRPLLLVSFGFNYDLSSTLHGIGYDPRTWHWFNMALHWLASLGLFFVGSMLIGSGRLSPLPRTSARAGDLLSLAAAVVFTVHPVTTECVNYISARSSLMPAAFLLPALALYLAVLAGRLPWWGLGCSLLLATAAMLTKVEAVAFLGVVVLAEMFLAPAQQSAPLWRRPLHAASWLRITPFFVVTLAYLWLWKHMSTLGDNPLRAHAEMTKGVYFLTQVRAWWHYIAEALAPVYLIADESAYPVSGGIVPVEQRGPGEGAYSFARALADPRVWLALTGWAIVGVWCLRLVRVFPAAAFLVGSFLCFLAPHSSIVPLAEMVNGHRPYLPLAGLFILGVSGVWLAVRALSARPGAALAALLAFVTIPLIALTRERNEVWRDELSLWSDSAAKSPESSRAQMNLGLALMKRSKYDDAEARFRRCLSITPYYHYAHTNLAVVLAAKGDKIGAAASHDAAVRSADVSREGGPYYWRARFRAKEGNLEGAIADLQISVERNAAAFREAAALVECLIRVGRIAETPSLIAQYSAADPNGFEVQRSEFRASVLGAESAIAVNDRGVALMRQAKYVEAEALYRYALQLDPKSHLAMTNMGIVRGAQGDAAGEAEWHDRAVEAGGDLASPWYWRARSYAAKGQLDRAATDLQTSLTKRNAGLPQAAAFAAVLLAQGKGPEASPVVSQWRPMDPAGFDAAVAEVQAIIPRK